MIGNDAIPVKTDYLLERDLGDEIVVMSPEGKFLHTFEGSARFIWSLIDGVRTIETLVECITQEYQVSTSIARSDLESFLAELRSLSLSK
jgi:Coenzyme PQQ synthesis protein D (PqqD)